MIKKPYLMIHEPLILSFEREDVEKIIDILQGQMVESNEELDLFIAFLRMYLKRG
jgi:hypothetical protein